MIRTAAWRIANRRALTIIFSCVPSSLKRDLRPPSSPSLWKSLSSQYDRQDLRSLLSLFRTFQDITLDSSLNAASFARRLTDTAQRLNDRGILISDTLLTARILDCLPPTYDTYRINFTSQHIRLPPVAVTIDWLLDSEADLLRESASINAVHARKGTNTGGSSGGGPGRGSGGGGRGGGRGGGQGGRTGERGGRGAITSTTGGLSPCQSILTKLLDGLPLPFPPSSFPPPLLAQFALKAS
ncbi:unnamed protein product [Closterium sp. NIES-65]|nr:unnamed protein product [Closterium sp. NIES-65]